MANEETRIRLKIDLKGGTLELDAPPGDFELAIQRTRELASCLHFGETSMTPAPRDGVKPEGNTAAPPSDGSIAAPKPQKARSAGSKASTGRPGRLGSFEPIRDLLSEGQHKEIYSYLQKKAPVDQEDQILVVMHKGEQLLERQGFSYNEIYTLLWRAGVDPLPKAIDVVIQRMIQDQKMDKSDAGFFLKFLGQSRVENELPISQKSAD